MSYKRWIIVAISLFGVGITFGLSTPATIADLFAEDLRALEELSRILTPFSVLTALFIFMKNMEKIF